MARRGALGRRCLVGRVLRNASRHADAESHRAFDALAAGGKVGMPLQKVFWSPLYGMVTDRFGLQWMVMVPGEPMP